jgi:glycosyltransferase involved in cell wall biosynthesis
VATPAVTIITPTFNQAPYVDRCIESVLAQSFQDWELVVVDDGSTDGTPEAIRRHSDPRIQLVECPHRGVFSLAESYSIALGRSRGELVALLDGDDWWPPEKLSIQVPGFQNPQVGFSFGSARLFSATEVELGTRALPSFARGLRAGSDIALRMLHSGFYVFSVTTVVRRAALTAGGGFVQPPGLPLVDSPTWLNVLPGSMAIGYEEVMGCYRIHGQSICRTLTDEVVEGQQRFNRNFLDRNWRALGLEAGQREKVRRRMFAYQDYVDGMRWLEKGRRLAAARCFRDVCVRGTLEQKLKGLARFVSGSLLGAGVPRTPSR